MDILINIKSIIVKYLIRYKLLPNKKELSYNNLTLSFSDEFDGRRLDTTKWMTHYYWGDSKSESEYRFYSHEAFKLDKSCLTINVENKLNKWPFKDGLTSTNTDNITSGLIHTGEFFKQRYGRFEVRCQVPLTEGYIPAFWLIDPNSYPPEIDVMDFSEGKNNEVAIGYTFGDDNSPKHFHKVKKILKNLKLSQWNIYTLDWTPTCLIWYVNGYEVHRVSNIGIPQCPMYVALNMAISNINTNQKSPTSINLKMDWIRVYKFS